MDEAQTSKDGTASTRWTRVEWTHVACLCLLTIAHWAPRLRGPSDLRYDAGVYYVLGTSLAQGAGYRLANEPGAIQAIQYPPLLPAWIALHQLALGTDEPLAVGQVLRLSSFALSLLYAVCAYALARRWLAARWALLAGTLAVLYFHTLYLEDLCFAEVPFGLVTLAFFLAHGARRAGLRALSFPLAVAAFLLRTAGVALLGAWVLEALLRRSWRPFTARLVVAAACVFGWQAYVWSVVNGPEYEQPSYAYQRAPYQYYNVSYAENLTLLDPFAPELGRATPLALVQRSLVSVPRLVLGLGESVSAPRGFWEWPLRSLAQRLGGYVPLKLTLLPLTLLGLVVAAGLVLLARGGRVLVVLYVLSSLGLVSLLPWPAQVPRYLAPLVPLLAIALAGGLAALPARARFLRGALVVMVLAVQGFTAWKTFAVYHHELVYPRADGTTQPGELFLFDEAQAWRRFYLALGWLRANTEPQAVVASSCAHLVWIHAGRKAILPPLESDPEVAQFLLDSAGVGYVVVDELAFLDVTRRYARPALERHPERWEIAYRDPQGWVTIYRRLRAD